MNYLETLYEVMRDTKNLAIATSLDDNPNVRIMDFVFDQKSNTIYVATFKENQKVTEFIKNPNVSITTIPNNNQKHVRSKNATIQESQKSIFEIADLFIDKNPDFKSTLEMAGPTLKVFEIVATEYMVIPDIQHAEIVVL